MQPYAVLETGGKQYRVSENDIVEVEKLDATAGTDVTFDQVLAVSNGETLSVGAPYVEGISIRGTVIEQFRAPKVVSFKYKKRKGYSKTIGHRQDLTRIKINGWGKPKTTKAAEPAEEEPAVEA